MTSNVLKIADEIFKLLEDLTDDPDEQQAVLQVVANLTQIKLMKLARAMQGKGGVLG